VAAERVESTISMVLMLNKLKANQPLDMINKKDQESHTRLIKRNKGIIYKICNPALKPTKTIEM